jgi:hypothetical protein
VSAASTTPTVLLRDEAGNLVGLVLDGAVYRLQTEAKVSNFPATQPVSAASLPLPSGAATSANQTTEIAGLSSIDAQLALIKAKTDNLDVALSTRAVPGLTDAQLRAAAVPVSGTFFQATQPVSAASLPLPTGAATEATLATRATETTLAAVKAKTDNLDVLLSTILTLAGFQARINTFGQKAMAASTPVVIASNQTTLAVSTAPSNSTPTLAVGDVTLAVQTLNAIRRTAYTEQSANFTGSIVSSSANDAAAGTGARAVKIFFVDATGATAGNETVPLNGTTPVNLVTTTKCFVERMDIVSVGSGGVAAGTVSLKTGAAGAGTTVGTIAAGDTQTFWAHHYVVTGKTSNVTDINVGNSVTNAGVAIYVLKALPIGVANAVEKQVSDFVTLAGASSSVNRPYGSQIQVVGPARVLLYVTPGTGSSFVYRGSFDCYDV